MSLAVLIGVLHWRAEQLPSAERALRDGRFAEAREHLSRCLSWSPDNADVLCLAARLERVEGHLDAAATRLEQCQQRNGTSPRSALESSLLRAQRGDLLDEKILLKLADDDNPQSPWILEALARAHMDALRFRHALVYLDRWLKLQPECVRALEWRGRMLEYIRHIDDALRVYEEVIRLEPGRWQVRLRLVHILQDNSRVKQASPHVAVLEKEHPEHPDVRLALGIRAAFEGKIDAARTWFLRCLEAEPNHSRALLQLGKLELQQEKAVEAEKWLSRAVELNPYDKYAHYALSECLSRLEGREAEAEWHFQLYDSIDWHTKRLNSLLNTKATGTSTAPEVLTEIGTHFLAVGQGKTGILWFYKALQSDANYRPAHAALADYYEQAGQPEKAAAHRRHTGTAPSRPGNGKSSALSLPHPARWAMRPRGESSLRPSLRGGRIAS
jgi:tetratricopeptide (TPR) repeat protein